MVYNGYYENFVAKIMDLILYGYGGE